MYDPDSKLRDQFKEFYLKHTGKQLKEVASHGGLETGIFKGKKPNLDIITMGPDMSDIHTPDERMNIDSFVLVPFYFAVIYVDIESFMPKILLR